METDDSAGEKRSWIRGLKNPATIARILGVLLFGLLLWLQSPPKFLQGAGFAANFFGFSLWLGEVLVYAIGIAGILILFAFAGWHIFHLIRNARRWFRLQEIRSWRAKRACNYPAQAGRDR